MSCKDMRGSVIVLLSALLNVAVATEAADMPQVSSVQYQITPLPVLQSLCHFPEPSIISESLRETFPYSVPLGKPSGFCY